MVTNFITEAGFIGTSACQARRGGGRAMLAGAGAGLRSPPGLTGSGTRVTVPGGGGRGDTTIDTAVTGTPARASACTTSGGSGAWAKAGAASRAAASRRQGRRSITGLKSRGRA